jgi:hypothetical protein
VLREVERLEAAVLGVFDIGENRGRIDPEIAGVVDDPDLIAISRKPSSVYASIATRAVGVELTLS